MNEHRHEVSLVLMCRVLKVARAGCYQWLHVAGLADLMRVENHATGRVQLRNPMSQI